MRALSLAGVVAALALAGCAHGARTPAPPPPPPAPPTPAPALVEVELEPETRPPGSLISRQDFEPATEPDPSLIARQDFEPAAGRQLAPQSQIPDPLAVGRLPPPSPVGLRGLCRQPRNGEQPIDEDTRRWLMETFCGATLWFDGLFGGEANVANARSVSGRVELSTIYTEAEGLDPKARLRLRYDLPNLKRKINLFVDRDDTDRIIEDRREGLAIRSSVFDLDDEDAWLAGLGYSPPGRFAERLDFRVGGRVKTAPEVFVQARWRRNFFVGDRTVWRFRETLFFENREGFGATTTLDADRILRPNLLLHWSGVGTFSEEVEGVEWRSAFVLYKNLGRERAIAVETFSRGETEAPVELREYGTRMIFRRPVGRRPHLYGELIVGYSFPREDFELEREGSAMLGFGLELLFGGNPF